jgi:hypothetical protein
MGMGNFRKLAHLVEQIGEWRLDALLDPANTGKVRGFCDELIEASLPKEMTLDGVTYEIISFNGHEKRADSLLMARWVEAACAYLKEEDLERIERCWRDVPAVFCGKSVFATAINSTLRYFIVDPWGWRELPYFHGAPDMCRLIRRKARGENAK